MGLGKLFTIREISDIVNGSICGNDLREINNISIDSRSLVLASKCLFFALTGHNNDGHDYIQALYKLGFKCFVVEKSFSIPIQCTDASFVFVNNSLEALQALARHKRNSFNNKILAITGSKGKTIVKEFLYQLLSPIMKLSRSPKSYNSQVGVPLSLWSISDSSELAIIEAGISLPGEMKKHRKMIIPDEGMFTFLGDAHGENFASREKKLTEKLKLFKHVEKIYYCCDDILVDSKIKIKFLHTTKLINWSRKDKYSDLYIFEEKIINNTSSIKAIYKNNTKSIIIPFVDNASIDNFIHAWLYCLSNNIDDDYLVDKASKLSAVAMRLEIKEAVANCIIINDYYNSDLDSLPIALDLLNQQAGNKSTTVILSDILQHSDSAMDLYAKVASLLNEKQINKLIGVGSTIAKFSYLFADDSEFYPTTDALIKELDYNKFSNEIILLRGAREFYLEKISILLQKKAHRTILEVDLTALVHNLNYYRSLLNEKTKLCVMVKAFSYGCGSVQLAKVLQYHRVDYLAVAIADEGIELRKAGVTIPIIVMNPEEYSFYSMIEYSLEPEIYSFAILKSFSKVLVDSAMENYPVHIKLDTGMLRMGFELNDMDELMNQIQNTSAIRISSVFSHLAYADSSMGDGFTLKQLELFDILKNKLESKLNYKVQAHILNTAGIERFPYSQYNMVRLGIGLYGVSCSMQEKLKNVVSLRTNISQIKTLSQDSPVGYSCSQILPKGSKIAVIPIGYADGFSRKFSRGVGKVLINGQWAPVVGAVCMDMSMINITGMDVSVGDAVLIFGDEYPVSQLAKQINTIAYEVLTGISARVKRLYLYE